MPHYPAWINGAQARCISHLDRGLTYGDGLFETIAILAGRFVFLEDHLARLQTGAQRLKIAFPKTLNLAAIQRYYQNCGKPESAIFKIILTRGAGHRGYYASLQLEPTHIFTMSDYPDRAAWRRGIHLFPCATALSEQPVLAGMKHLNRLEQVLARSEWNSSYYGEGLMCDLQGHAVCGTMSNLFIVRDQVLYSPSLEKCGIAGIARATILKMAQQVNQTVRIDKIRLPFFMDSDEAFLCNSVFGVWPVHSYQQKKWRRGGWTAFYQKKLESAMQNA